MKDQLHFCLEQCEPQFQTNCLVHYEPSQHPWTANRNSYLAQLLPNSILQAASDFINPGDQPFAKVAVVLLAYNARPLVEQLLPKVLATNYNDFEVVVVDNGSHDDLSNFISEQYPELKRVRVHNNKGFTNGYVESLQYIKSKYYVLLSADVEVESNWMAPIIQIMEADSSVAAAMPKVRSFDNRSSFEYAGAAGGMIDKFGYPFCRGRLLDRVEEDQAQYESVCEVFWATGAAMFIRSEIYHKFGGLDDDFFAHFEEIDLCWRIKNAGYKIVCVPECVVYHMGGHIIAYRSPAKFYRNYRNSLISLVKNAPKGKLTQLLGIRLMLDYAAMCWLGLRGQFKEVGAIMKAHRSFYAGWTKWKKKRYAAQQQVANPNLAGVFEGSLIHSVFVGGAKTFSEMGYTIQPYAPKFETQEEKNEQ